jgi:GntR family transcriptional regulator / MocR family aminotransferase
MLLRLDGEGPLHRQTYRALREAILGGRLRPGERLASTRELCRDLQLSRNTVLSAYEQLVAEGYAVARPASGTFVADTPPRRAGSAPEGRGATPARARPVRLSALARRFEAAVPHRQASWSLPREPVRFDFRYGEPAYADLPLATWGRLLGRRARRMSVRRLAYQPPGGAPELREALAGYLARARGVSCSAEQVVVVAGTQQAIDLTTRLLVDPGDRVVVEEPHYTGFTFCLAAVGAEVTHVAVDEDGLRVEELESIASARLVCVTPSHQFPAGGVLSLARRLALLDWASSRAAYVLEDDYDGEFRFDGRPLACLQGLDRDGRVLYAGTASKIFFPALRIGWLVVPPELVAIFRSAKALSDTGTASLEQLAFADFIAGGHLERHVRRARRRHAARRRVLLDALESHLGDRARVLGVSAGVHVLLRLEGLPHRELPRLRAACRERSVGVYPASPFYARPPARAELLLGYGGLEERAIREAVRRLASAVDAVASRRS